MEPKDDDLKVFDLQNELLKEAEILLGSRDSSKKIYHPSWDNDGPHIRYSPSKDGACAELGTNAKNDWMMCVYQLAHEVIHLLDQHGGDQTTLLEEGIAVKFSLDMLEKYGFESTDLPTALTYKNALLTLNKIDSDPYKVVKKCRQLCGNFISIDKITLLSICTNIDESILDILLEKPIMR